MKKNIFFLLLLFLICSIGSSAIAMESMTMDRDSETTDLEQELLKSVNENWAAATSYVFPLPTFICSLIGPSFKLAYSMSTVLNPLLCYSSSTCCAISIISLASGMFFDNEEKLVSCRILHRFLEERFNDPCKGEEIAKEIRKANRSSRKLISRENLFYQIRHFIRKVENEAPQHPLVVKHLSEAKELLPAIGLCADFVDHCALPCIGNICKEGPEYAEEYANDQEDRAIECIKILMKAWKERKNTPSDINLYACMYFREQKIPNDIVNEIKQWWDKLEEEKDSDDDD